MSNSPTPVHPRRFHGSIAPLAVVITTNLATAHTTGQYLAGLAALALALTHDALTHTRPAAGDT
jgi:hypothetical protein